MKKLYTFACAMALAISLAPAVSCQAAPDPTSQEYLAAANSKLPAIQLQSSNKGEVDGSELQYKAIIIDVWASWCGPCREEIPILRKLQKEYGNKLQVLGISLDDNEKDHLKAIKELGISYPSCSAENPTNAKFLKKLEAATGEKIDGIPYLVIADRQGHIFYSDSGTCDREDLKQIIDPLMK